MDKNRKKYEITYLSDYLKVDKIIFQEKKIYNPVLGFDAQLFVDPVLLEKSSIKEFKNSKEKVKQFFSKVAELVVLYSKETDKKCKETFKKAALEYLSFEETPNTFLGFSVRENRGSGIGKKLAEKIFNNLLLVLKYIEKDEIYMDLFPIFSEYIREDRYSDLLISILKDELTEFSKRMIQEMGSNTYAYNGSDIFIFPQEILVKKQLSVDIFDKDKVHSAVINKFFKDKIQGGIKEAILEMYKKYKENLLEWNGYNFDIDIDLVQRWSEIGKEISSHFALPKNNIQNQDDKNLLENTIFILNEFKHIIENNGIGKLFYNETDKKPRSEKSIQKVFFAAAYHFCRSNNIDLSPETDAGRGYVDFKTSRGIEKVAIEFKIGKNLQSLNHGFYKQLEEYKSAERTDKGIFVILILNVDHEKNYDNFIKEWNVNKNRPNSEIVIIDGREKKSASKI